MNRQKMWNIGDMFFFIDWIEYYSELYQVCFQDI